MGIRFYLVHEKKLQECYVGKARNPNDFFDPCNIFNVEDVYGKKKVTREHITSLFLTEFKDSVKEYLAILTGSNECGSCGNKQVNGKCQYCGWIPNIQDIPDDLWVEWG